MLDALAKGLLLDENVNGARILASNTSNGILGTSVWWVKNVGSLDGPRRIEEDGVRIGSKPSANYPWQVNIYVTTLNERERDTRKST